MNQPDPAAPGFSEQSLRQAIINTWGPAGAHIDVYDHLLAALATAEKERETATNVAKRANAALDATCRREEAERAVLQSCKQALDLYFVWATSGPDKDQEYIDGVLSAQLGQVDEMLANYHKATGPQAENEGAENG